MPDEAPAPVALTWTATRCTGLGRMSDICMRVTGALMHAGKYGQHGPWYAAWA